jgi:hypothetical protein
VLSRQADTGIAAQKATTVNINNAPFLPQFMVYRSRVSILSIRHRALRSGDSDHIRDSRRPQLLRVNLSDSLKFCGCLRPGATCSRRESEPGTSNNFSHFNHNVKTSPEKRRSLKSSGQLF